MHLIIAGLEGKGKMKIKADHQIVVIVIVFFVGFSLRSVVDGDRLPIKEVITGIVTLIAASAGASFAFKLQHEKEERDNVIKHVASANRAIYTLKDIWSIQKQYQEEIISPCGRQGDAWLNMSPTVHGMHEKIKFNVENLDFLLGCGKPEIYSDLLLEEKRYGIVISIIEERSKLFFDKVYPKIESLGINKGDMVDPIALEKGFGPDLTNRLKSMTDAIIKNIDENLDSLINVHEIYQAYLKEIYPTEKFIKVIFEKKA